MRRFIIPIIAASAVLAGTTVSGSAQAVPIGGRAVSDAATHLGIVADAQYWGGHRWCWYDSAWNGPGWYWCGYPWRSGFGWGGGRGWHGWGGRGWGGRGWGGRGWGGHGGGHGGGHHR